MSSSLPSKIQRATTKSNQDIYTSILQTHTPQIMQTHDLKEKDPKQSDILLTPSTRESPASYPHSLLYTHSLPATKPDPGIHKRMAITFVFQAPFMALALTALHLWHGKYDLSLRFEQVPWWLYARHKTLKLCIKDHNLPHISNTTPGDLAVRVVITANNLSLERWYFWKLRLEGLQESFSGTLGDSIRQCLRLMKVTKKELGVDVERCGGLGTEVHRDRVWVCASQVLNHDCSVLSSSRCAYSDVGVSSDIT